jgi:hypothetical protein
MNHVIFEIDHGEEFFDEEYLDVPQGFTELEPLGKQWHKDHFEPYRRTRDARYPVESVQIEFVVLPDTQPLRIVVPIDQAMFAQFAGLYARYGWRVVEAMYRDSTDRRRPYSFPARSLIEKTTLALRKAVEQELVALEHSVSTLAHATWTRTLATMRGWLDQFEQVTKSSHALVDRDKGKKLHQLFVEYHKAEHSRAAIAKKREAVDHAGRYRPGQNDSEYPNFFNTFGKDELALQAEMEATARSIHELFEPGLFALLTSESVLAKDTTRFHGIELSRSYGEVQLSTAIHESVNAAIRELDAMVLSLNYTGAASSIAADSRNEISDPHVAIARNALDTWTFGETFRKMVSGDTSQAVAAYNFIKNEKLNTVLASVQMLDVYVEKARALQPEAWGRFVASHYRHELKHQESIDANQKAIIGKVTRVFRFVAAAVSLLAFFALVVASDGAAASSIAIWCSLIKSLNEGITLGILAVTALEMKGAQEDLAKEWKAAVSAIKGEDPETIMRVGDALWGAHELGIEVTKALAMILLPLALTRLVKGVALQFGIETEADVVGHAMDLEGIADDVDGILRELPVVIGLVGNALEGE